MKILYMLEQGPDIRVSIIRANAIFNLLIAAIAGLIFLFVEVDQSIVNVAVALLIVSVTQLVCLKLNRIVVATTIFNLAGGIILVYFSQTSYAAFLISTTGFVAFIFWAQMVTKARIWVLGLLITQLYMMAANAQYIADVPLGDERELRILMSIVQSAVLFAASAAIGVGQSVLLKANERANAALEEVQRQTSVLQQQSAELNQMLEALTESESRYRALVESANEAILLCELPSWRVIDANIAACEQFNYSLDELREIDVLTKLAQGPRVALNGDLIERGQFEPILQLGELVEYEQMHLERNGNAFMCRVRMVRLSNTSQQIRITITNIEEERAIRMRERALAERLRLVSDNIPVRIVYFDHQLNLQFWNRTFAEAFDLLDTAPPLAADVALEKSLYEETLPHLKLALEGRRTQFEWVRDDEVNGGRRWGRVTFTPHLVDGQIEGLFGVAVDISAERDAQRRLAETSDFLQLITDNMPARLSYVTKDDTILFLNKQFEKLGIDRSRVIGSDATLAIPSPLQAGMLDLKQKVLSGQTASFERRVELEAGGERYENVMAVPHFVDSEVQGYIVLVSDVTQWREAEAAFHQSQKAESLGVLAGGIAHDFNNLLVAILGQSTLARAKMAPDHAARRHLEKVVDASERAATLTNQMLAYSGRGAFSIAPLHLNTLIKQNLQLFRASIEHTIDFRTEFDQDLPLIQADAAQVQQVIMNLIINAAQAVDQLGGKITVSTKFETFEALDVTSLNLIAGQLHADAYAVVSVKDNGVGMSAETVERIFEPFFTTKETGSGLGLAAVLGIMRGHKGGIAVQSDVGVGTQFKLFFPANEVDTFARRPSAETKPVHLSTRKTILIIDDDADVSGVVADILSEEDLRTVEINDPVAAIDYFDANHMEIDLVILDLMMPKLNGMQVYQRLAKIDPSVRVVLSSGYSREDVLNRFVVSDIRHFLQKPYNYNDLLEIVGDALMPAEVA